jgi:hypothetical protein
MACAEFKVDGMHTGAKSPSLLRPWPPFVAPTLKNTINLIAAFRAQAIDGRMASQRHTFPQNNHRDPNAPNTAYEMPKHMRNQKVISARVRQTCSLTMDPFAVEIDDLRDLNLE